MHSVEPDLHSLKKLSLVSSYKISDLITLRSKKFVFLISFSNFFFQYCNAKPSPAAAQYLVPNSLVASHEGDDDKYNNNDGNDEISEERHLFDLYSTEADLQPFTNGF